MKKSIMKKFTFLDEPIVFKYMDNQHTFSKHIHEHDYMIGTPVVGKSLFTVEEKSYEVDIEELCIIPSNVVHSRKALDISKEWKFFNFHPSVNLLQNIAKSICPNENSFSFNDYFIKDKELSLYLIELVYSTLIDEKIYKDGILNFLTRLFEKHANFKGEITPLGKEKFEPLFLYLKNEEYSLKELDFYKMAEIMNMNPYYFHRLFSKTIGLTPQTYINALRITKSTKLIKKYDSLALVAQECGFYDQAYFTKQFKKYYGITPTNFKSI